MSSIAFKAQGLSKVFKVWKRPSDMLLETITGRRRHSEFNALQDVSFEMPAGCVMGVLGRNGAGKSTLLRLIAGTLEATSGAVETGGGRVAAILELGTGFHPEYSGRDNVLLGGLCLGLTRQEVAARLDEIVDFAELEDVIDQPFRTYSSGMQARLTFAVATSVDADILIIDEALSVGDARFSLKSFDRIQAFRRQGKAILLVSHDINTVNSFCDQALLLEHGRLIASGEPKAVGHQYHQLLFGEAADAGSVVQLKAKRQSSEPRPESPGLAAAPKSVEVEPEMGAGSIFSQSDESDHQSERNVEDFRPKEHRYGDGKALIFGFYIRDKDGRRVSRLSSLSRYEFVLLVEAVEEVEDVCVGVLIRSSRGADLFGADSLSSGGIARRMRVGDEVVYVAAFENNLAPGSYFATASLARVDGRKHDLRFDALEFIVESAPGVYDSSLVNLDMSFELQAADSERSGAPRTGALR